jgi:preprotein translocase subunit SecF
MHATSDELEYMGYAMYDNIVITDGAGAVKLIIFRDAADWDGTTMQSHVKDSTSTLECLSFTQENLDEFLEAAKAKMAEAISREAAKAGEAASKEASREQASIDASIRQSEQELEEAAAKNKNDEISEERTEAALEEKTKEDTASEKEIMLSAENGSNTILAICFAAAGFALVIAAILIAATGKNKKMN